MKKKLLYLVHRIPYPPNKGDKIPSFNMLKYFSKEFDIYLGTFIDDPDDWQYVDKVRDYCTELCVEPLEPRKAKLFSLRGLFTSEPLSLPYYRNRNMQRWVDKILFEEKPDAVLIFSGVMAQFVSGKMAPWTYNLLDLVDVDSDKWRMYAEKHRWPMSWIYRRESRLLLQYERAMAAEFSATLFVSEKEAEFFKSLAPELAEKIHYRVQGVDSQFFDPNRDYPSPYPADEKVILFVGAMDYWPNIDAGKWFADEVFPLVLDQVPEACFYIVGMNPDESVMKLGNNDTIHVTGRVDDVRHYMAHADLAVAPLRVARGIQNKVLEAMAMNLPIIASTHAMTGIHYQNEQFQPIVTDDPEVMSLKAIELFQSVDNSSYQGGRQVVLDGYNWNRSLQELSGLLGIK